MSVVLEGGSEKVGEVGGGVFAGLDDFVVVELAFSKSGGPIGEHGNADDLHSERAGLDRLGHRGHADGIGTESSEHADFGGGFVLGATNGGIDALMEHETK